MRPDEVTIGKEGRGKTLRDYEHEVLKGVLLRVYAVIFEGAW